LETLDQILHSYYTFLSTLDYKFFIQLSPTMTKLCDIKCHHPACVSNDGEHFDHIMVVTLNNNMAKLEIGPNWIKICSLA